MNELLLKFTGKAIAVSCGGSLILRGEITKVEDGLLHLKDKDGKLCHVAIDKIAVVWEATEPLQRPGFISGT
jgi:Domain of unknown function (DUF6897)